jgi:hypothetical protein
MAKARNPARDVEWKTYAGNGEGELDDRHTTKLRAPRKLDAQPRGADREPELGIDPWPRRPRVCASLANAACGRRVGRRKGRHGDRVEG